PDGNLRARLSRFCARAAGAAARRFTSRRDSDARNPGCARESRTIRESAPQLIGWNDFALGPFRLRPYWMKALTKLESPASDGSPDTLQDELRMLLRRRRCLLGDAALFAR